MDEQIIERLRAGDTEGVTLLQIAQLLLLRAGLRQVCRRADIAPQGDPLKGAAIWQVLVIVLALSPLAHSWLAVLPMLVAYVCIVRALFRLGGALEKAGYCFAAAPVRLGARTVMLAFFGGCLLLTLAAGMLVNHPRLDAAPMPEPGETGTRQQLSALGLPDEVLQDLADEDVRALAGASHVACCAKMAVFSEGYDNMTLCDQTNHPERAPVEPEIPPGKDTMIASTYYIELPDYRLAVLNHFAWVQGSAYWGDAFSAIVDSDGGYDLLGGRLIYEKQGQTYAAPVPGLVDEVVTTVDFFGEQTGSRISGMVNYPFFAENPRGYVIYIAQLGAQRTYGGTNLLYYHAASPLLLPYQTPQQRTAQIFDDRVFNHYSNFNTALGREKGN